MLRKAATGATAEQVYLIGAWNETGDRREYKFVPHDGRSVDADLPARGRGLLATHPRFKATKHYTPGR
jgi:hypothetical protein